MSRREWWIWMGVLVVAVLLHAMTPRYEWQHQDARLWLRVDRWTGNAELITVSPVIGREYPIR